MGPVKATKRKATSAAARRKATAAGHDAPKDLAAKKKHVRELAKRCDWAQVRHPWEDRSTGSLSDACMKDRSVVRKEDGSKGESVYELKLCEWGGIGMMVDTCAKDVAKNGGSDSTSSLVPPPTAAAAIEPEKVTPQMLAKQILAMNGYSSVPAGRDDRDRAGSDRTARGQEGHPDRRGGPSLRLPPTDKRLKQRVDPLCSPSPGGILKRSYASSACASKCPPSLRRAGTNNPAQFGTTENAIVILDSPERLTEEQKRRIEDRRRQALEKRKRTLAPVVAATPVPQNFSQQEPQARKKTNQPTLSVLTNLAESKKTFSIDDSMMQELEFAAQVTDWDIDEPIRSNQTRLVTPPSPQKSRQIRQFKPNSSQPFRGNCHQNVAESRVPSQPVLSKDEGVRLLSTNAHYRETKPTGTLSQELAAAAAIPWSQLDDVLQLPSPKSMVGPTNKRKNDSPHASSARVGSKPDADTSRRQHDGPPESPATPVVPDESDDKRLQAFMAKHFLDEKMDEAVLEFVNMMLA